MDLIWRKQALSDEFEELLRFVVVWYRRGDPDHHEWSEYYGMVQEGGLLEIGPQFDSCTVRSNAARIEGAH